jgi:hypothetical protein
MHEEVEHVPPREILATLTDLNQDSARDEGVAGYVGIMDLHWLEGMLLEGLCLICIFWSVLMAVITQAVRLIWSYG